MLAGGSCSNHTGGMKLLGYARASTEDQELTLEAQPGKLRCYCELHEHNLVDIVVASESAKSLDRSGLQSILTRLRDNEADGMLVVKLDRLTRELEDW